ncbi:MAG: WD40 repeat domain-containing protein, partial [Stackebrandtia sp.]
WELATGRCVNVLDGIFGGVGWPSHRDDLQWSADGRVLAANHIGCMVGRWDPFGDQVDPPLAQADFRADIASREPVGFALDPDGSRVFLHYSPEEQNEDSGVDGCLIPWHPVGQVPDAEELAETSDELHESLNGAAMGPFVSVFSADGSRIWGFGEWRWEEDEDEEDVDVERGSGAFAIDVASRRLIWFVDTGFGGLDDFDRMAVSPDETIVALNHGETLDFIDASNGHRLAAVDMPFDAARLRWGRRGSTQSLAVVDIHATSVTGVRIYDGTRHRYDLPLTPKRPDYHFPDGHTWAWSPDGARAACLTTENRVEIWELGEEPRRASVLEAPADALGLWWGTGEVLAIGGPHSLRFVSLADAVQLGDFPFSREIPAPRPLSYEKGDLGYRFRPNPTFALNEEHWAAAFTEGAVIAPADSAETLDATLAWSVDRRHAWPYRWGEVEPAADIAGCFRTLSRESQAILRPLRDRKGPAASAEYGESR